MKFNCRTMPYLPKRNDLCYNRHNSKHTFAFKFYLECHKKKADVHTHQHGMNIFLQKQFFTEV